MKKYIFALLFTFLSIGTSVAQNEYWEHPGVDFNGSPVVMYYDSVTQKSYIGGDFTQVDSVPCRLLVYDGQSYSPFPIPSGVGNLRGIVRYRDKLYICGFGSYLAAWDGNTWAVIDSGVFLNLKVFDDKLYVMGSSGSNSLVLSHGGVGVWNDTVWTGLLGLDSIINIGGWAVNDIAFYKGNVYVGGNFHNFDRPELPADFIMHDGVSWKQVGNWGGSGMGGVKSLLIWRDTLYVAGLFIESPIVPGNGIAAWDGQQWHRLQQGVRGGSEASSAVFGVDTLNGELWVAGYFTTINGRYVDQYYGNVAKWDGSQWCTMNTRLYGGVNGIGRWKDELFILSAANLYSDPSKMCFFKWAGGSYTDTCTQNFTLGVESVKESSFTFHLFPNPAKDRLNVVLSANAELRTIRISDLFGRVKYEKYGSKLGSTIELDLSKWNSGIYWISIVDKSGRLTSQSFSKMD